MSPLKFVVVGTLLLCVQCLSAQDDAARTKYLDLVHSLISSNSPAETIFDAGESRVKFPARYDASAQSKIQAARQTLQNEFEAAIPLLVAAFDDERYCMTISWAEGDAYYNRTVGEICRELVASHLEVYRNAIAFEGPIEWNQFDYPISEKWYQSRTTRSLAQLQVEAVDWAIARHQKKFAGEDRGDELKEMRRLRDKIEKSNVAAAPQRLLRMVTTDHPRSKFPRLDK